MPYPNWFTVFADQYFERHLRDYAGKPDLRFLQIGAFTGDATLWLLEHVLTGDRSMLVDVDTWQGSDEVSHRQFDWTDVEQVYDRRTAAARKSGRLQKHRMPSLHYFIGSVTAPFDFIYVDGDHTAFAVLNDAVNAYLCLKPGGLLAFDDYLWESGNGDHNNPAPAIDAIRSIYRDRLELVDMGQQVWFRRVR